MVSNSVELGGMGLEKPKDTVVDLTLTEISSASCFSSEPLTM